MLILLSFLFELLLLFNSVSGRNLNVWNYCETTIWPAYGSTAASSTASFGGWRADPSTPRVLNLADDWQGYIWARQGCEFPESDSCKTGSCDGGLECTGLGSSPPAATLVELSFHGGSSYTFDINISKRFDIPVAVENSNCVANLSCSLNFAASCPPALQTAKDDSGATLSCAVNSQSQSWFTSLCPMATVDPNSPVTQQICGSGDIDIQFCPQANSGPAPNPPTIPSNNPAPPMISHPQNPPPNPPSSGGGGNLTSTPPIDAGSDPAGNLRGSGSSHSNSSSTSSTTSGSHTSSPSTPLPESTIFQSNTQSASRLADQPSQSPSGAINNKGRSPPGLIIGIILGTLIPILLVGLTILFFCRRRRRLREVTGARVPISISSDTASMIASIGDVRFETSTDNLLQQSNSRPVSIARSQHDYAPPLGQSTLFPPEKGTPSTEYVHSTLRESVTASRQANHEDPFRDPSETPTQEEYVIPNVDLSRLYEDDRALDLALVEYLSRRVESYHPPTPPSYKTQPDHGT